MATSSLMFPAEASGLQWNTQAINARNAMTDFYGTLLNEVRKTDPNAQLSTIGGMAHIVTGGKSIPITSTHKADADSYGITPDQWVSSNVMGQPLTLTPEQRAKVQASQLSALQSVADTAVSGGPQVQANIDQLKAFWQTPAGQGIVDPNAQAVPVAAPFTGTALKLMSGPNGQGYYNPDGTVHVDTSQPAPGIQSPFGTLGPSPAVVQPVVKKAVETPPIVRATLPPIVRQDSIAATNNALLPQVNQPAQQVNQNYQRNLDRYRQNRWGRGGR